MVFHCIFLRKKAIIITIKTRHNDLFFSLQAYSKKTWEKMSRKELENTNEMFIITIIIITIIIIIIIIIIVVVIK